MAAGPLALPLISGDTRVVGIVGHPVAHSLSPAMHNAAFAALGLRWVYVAFSVEPQNLVDAIRGARALGLRGLNVTAPHKAAAAGLVDRLEGPAAEIGLVNTIVFEEDGAAAGHSTDGEGFLAACAGEGCEVDAGVRAVVVGAGGAGVSVARALLGCGARVVLANRDPGRLAGAMARLDRPGLAERIAGIRLGDPALRRELAAADLLVNSVPPASGVPEGLDLGALGEEARVADLAYHPAEPPVVAAARGRGLRAWNGLGMLVHQGAASFRLWTGRAAPLEAMAAAAGYELPGR